MLKSTSPCSATSITTDKYNHYSYSYTKDAVETTARKRPCSSHLPIMDSRTPSGTGSAQQHSKSRRRLQAQYDTGVAPLQLSGLPRFHPAAYSSNNNTPSGSRASTPSSSTGSAPPQPLSPRASQLRKSDPQRHLAFYHQTLLAQYAARDLVTSPLGGSGSNGVPLSPSSLAGGPASWSSSGSGSSSYRPPSPKLVPLGSPGAVTPLELESEGEIDGYLGARAVTAGGAGSSERGPRS